MFKLGFLFQFTEENLMISVPLSGFDIAGALLLKYCILLYFSFLGKYYWFKNNLSLSLSSKKWTYIFASYFFFYILTSSIYLIINYLYNIYPLAELNQRMLNPSYRFPIY